jgi:hypothetical protein
MFYNYFRDYDAAIGRYIQGDPLGLFTVGAAAIGRIGPSLSRLNNQFVYADYSPVINFDSKGLMTEAGTLGRLFGGAIVGGGRGAALGIGGLLGGAALGALMSCSPTDQERCERRCDAYLDWDTKQCEWKWKMTGRDPNVLRVCMDKARKDWLDCYQDCKH